MDFDLSIAISAFIVLMLAFFSFGLAAALIWWKLNSDEDRTLYYGPSPNFC